MYRAFGKRLADVVLATLLLIGLAPLFAVVSSLVWLRLGTPLLFRQRRAGLRGKPFTIAKFRTMTEARDASGKLRPDTDRLTPFGRFLRRSSIDELPQLWNVLRGDMSWSDHVRSSWSISNDIRRSRLAGTTSDPASRAWRRCAAAVRCYSVSGCATTASTWIATAAAGLSHSSHDGLSRRLREAVRRIGSGCRRRGRSRASSGLAGLYQGTRDR